MPYLESIRTALHGTSSVTDNFYVVKYDDKTGELTYRSVKVTWETCLTLIDTTYSMNDKFVAMIIPKNEGWPARVEIIEWQETDQ